LSKTDGLCSYQINESASVSKAVIIGATAIAAKADQQMVAQRAGNQAAAQRSADDFKYYLESKGISLDRIQIKALRRKQTSKKQQRF